MSFFVYILASGWNGTLYIGMTDDLTRRYFQHRNELFPGFTKRYGVKFSRLVRGAWLTRKRLCERAADEEMEQEVEARIDRAFQPSLA